MTHLNPGGAGTTAPPSMLSRPRGPEHHLDAEGLRLGITRRRRTLLELEMAMVAACEADAARGRAPSVRMDDRETWDRATWNRYLAAATRVEPEFGPPMQRLVREIDQLQRVLALATAMETATA